MLKLASSMFNIMDRSLFIVTILFVLYDNYRCDADIAMDCKQVEGLCLGIPYELSCTAPEDVQFHLVQLNGGKCEGEIEVDFLKSRDKVNKAECHNDRNCGQFCGTLKQKSPMLVGMNLIAKSSLEGAGIMCFGQSPSNSYQTTCKVSIAVPPNAPTNVKVSSCSPNIVSWDEPNILNGQADQSIRYHVAVNYSTTTDINLGEFIVDEKFMLLPERSKQDSIVQYSVCVSSVNCAGVSKPICTQAILGDASVLTPPEVIANALNSSAIQLTLTPTHNNNFIDNVCYDIETNFINSIECALGDQVIVHVGEGNSVYNIRVRARVEGLVGSWSKAACLLFSVPPAVVFNSYTVSNHLNTIVVNASVTAQDHSNVVSNCQLITTQKIEVFSGMYSVEAEVNELGAVQKEIALYFTNTSNVEKITLTGRAANIIGTGPDKSIDVSLND